MTKRSQWRKQELYGYHPPAITGINPDTATIAAAGTVGRVIASLTVAGGTPPITYTIANAAGLSLALPLADLLTAANPVGVAGTYPVSITAKDSWNKTLTETITVTVT